MTNDKEIFYNAKLNWWLTSMGAKAVRIGFLLICLAVYAEVLLPLYPIDNTVFPISITGLGGYLVSYALALQLLYMFAVKKGIFNRHGKAAKCILIALGIIGLMPAIQATAATLCIPVIVIAYLSSDKLPVFKGRHDVLASLSAERATLPQHNIQADANNISTIEITETPAGHEDLLFKFADGKEARLVLARQFSLESELINIFTDLVKRPPAKPGLT